MKSLILAMTLALSSLAFGGEIEASNEAEFQSFSLITSVRHTYSKTSGLDAKVIEMIGSDGVNPTRMILVVDTGYHDSKVFELGVMMYEVTRITFLAKDLIVINYIQDNFNDEGDVFQVNESIKIKVLRNADNTLADKIEIVE